MSAYVIAGKRRGLSQWLPISGILSDGTAVEVVELEAQTAEAEAVRRILNKEINGCRSYPQDEELDKQGFESYYLSHDAFCIRTEGGEPNFPGRCSHIANAGFVVDEKWRSIGVGKFLLSNYLLLARNLGFEAVFFNLVFADNLPSVKLWDSNEKFRRVGTIYRAAKNKDGSYQDAHQYYCSLIE